MAIADATQKNIVENTAAAGDELEQLNTKTDQVKELQENLLAEQEKGNKILAKSFGLDEDEIRRQKEKDAKAARASDGGGSLGPSPGGKGKGIFGLLGSMFKVLGGGFLKILGPIWKVLKIMFKGLGFIAIGAGALMALAFFQKDAKGQEEMINNVIDFFKGVGEALKKFGSIFSGSFMEGMDDKVVDGIKKEGLGTKFKKFGEAWGKVTKQISEISIGEYKGLDGVAKFMGDMFSKIIGWFTDIGTGIANLITDPTATLARMQANVESFFYSFGDAIGRLFDKFFNLEFLLTLLPSELVPDSWVKKASNQRFLQKQKEIAASEKNIANAEGVIAINKEKLAKLQKQKDMGKKVDETAIRNLQLSVTRSELDVERERVKIKHAKKAAADSQRSEIQREINMRMEKATGKDRMAALEKLKEEEERLNKRYGAEGMHGGRIKVNTGKTARGQRTKFISTGGSGTLDQYESMLAFIKEGGQLDSTESLALQQEQGMQERNQQELSAWMKYMENVKSGRESSFKNLEAKKKKLADEEAKILPKIEAAVFKKYGLKPEDLEGLKSVPTGHTGGLISRGGVIVAQKGEVLIDDILVSQLTTAAAAMSGLNLMNLQRQKLDSGSGAQNIIIQDNSVRSSNQSQPMILPPSPIEPGNNQSPGLLN